MTPTEFHQSLLTKIAHMREQADLLEMALHGGASALKLSAFSSAYINPHLSGALLDQEEGGTPGALDLTLRADIVEHDAAFSVQGIHVGITGPGRASAVRVAGEDAMVLQDLLEQMASLLRGAATKQATEIMQQVQEG